MKYVLYEGKGGDMLFTKEEIVNNNKENLLKPFENKTPTWTCDADDDTSAITLLNAHSMTRSAQSKK